MENECALICDTIFIISLVTRYSKNNLIGVKAAQLEFNYTFGGKNPIFRPLKDV